MRRKRYIGAAILIAACLLAYTLGVFGSLENRVQDALYKDLGLVDPSIVVFGIDEKTLAEFGSFQSWTRQRMADAIDILNSDPDYKPAVIGVDILYTGYSNPEADAALARAAEEGGNCVFSSNINYSNGIFSARNTITGYEKPFPELAQVSRYGFFNVQMDADGVLRRAVFREKWGDEELASFALEIARAYAGDDDLEVPNQSSVRVNFTGEIGEYYGNEVYSTSFCDIFDENFDPTEYADCVILIGPYANGLQDSYFTPLDYNSRMSGVEYNANVIQQILEGNYKYEVSRYFEGALLALILAAMAIGFGQLDIRWSLVITTAFCAVYAWFNKVLFDADWIVTLCYPIISAAAVLVYNVVVNIVVERRDKRKIRHIFEKYVDPSLVDKLIRTNEADSNAIGLIKDIAILFVDIRGFTPLTDSLKEQPETIVHILNEYLELTSSAIFKFGGNVDKFIGDATMGLFNGFAPLEDYEYRAVCSALEMVTGAASLNKRLYDKYGVDVGFGIGLHCGEAVVGNIGPAFRKDYTAIGHNVNMTARLESNAKASQVLISEELMERMGDRITTRPLGKIYLKGKGDTEVYELTGIAP